MNLLIFLALSLGAPRPAHARAAAETRGMKSIGNGRSLWVEHKPADPGRPTLVLLNGLTYTTRDWDAYVAALEALDPGVGIVRYDMRGMGPSAGHGFSDITLDDQSEDLMALMERLNLPGPVVLQGLSYGGGLMIKVAAEHPNRFAQFIAMAPFLSALPDMDALIERLVAQHRFWRPFDLRTRDELYDHYLRILVFSTYPTAEPVMWRDWPYKIEHVFRMVKGARRWLASLMIPRLPKGRVHLMFAEDDEYVSIRDSRAFAAALPDKLIGSILYMKNVRHKIPEVAPTLAARWTLRILNGEARMNEGLTWTVDRLKPSLCETLLGTAS